MREEILFLVFRKSPSASGSWTKKAQKGSVASHIPWCTHRERRGLGRARRTWNPPNRGMVAQNRLAEQRSSSGNERSSQSSASELPPAFRNHRGALSVSQLRLSSGSKSQRANAASPGPRNNASRRFQIGLARSCRCRESRIRTTSKSASVIIALFCIEIRQE